ncbi:MAG: hypothetical protein K9M44_00580 [Candidatus Pacebacteria bacterium]|nr:hypothetical protein [Candidatus Paceibacterota bacterium]
MKQENLNQEPEEFLEAEEFNEELEDENNEENLDYEFDSKPKKKKFKNKVILIELIIILILGAIVYFQFSSFSDKKVEVENNYQALQKLDSEINSCRELISQNQGEFDRYDYCRQLIQSFDN